MTGSGDRNKPKQAIAITEIRTLWGYSVVLV